MPQPARPLPNDTPDNIVRAALGLFTEKGYEGASTRAIASAAGVNHGLIPYYFGTKERLWRAAVDLAFEEMIRDTREALEDPSVANDRERAARMIRAHVRFIARRPEFVRLMYEEGKRKGPRMRWIVDRHVKPLYESLTPMINRLRDRPGAFTDLTPVHFFYILAGASGLVFHQAEECRRATGENPFDPEFVETHARVVEHLLLGSNNG